MIQVTSIVGARPQFIKASVISRHFLNHPELEIEEQIIHTGQHFDANMSAVFFDELSIPEPAYNLGINSSTHGSMTGKMLTGIEEIISQKKPHYVLVYGDTNSTLSGALAAKKLGIKVIHVEAGLRSFNMKMPEEINRIITDRISDILCCPTNVSMQNLKNEGFENFDCTLALTGDVMADAVRYFESSFDGDKKLLQSLSLTSNSYALCTIHRQENVDDPQRLARITKALHELSVYIPIIFPMHPRTRQKINLGNNPRIIVTNPFGYTENLQILKNSKLVLTDSGGLQKEAYLLKKFCITLRDETEWTELIEAECNIIAGADVEKILNAYHISTQKKWSATSNLYGDGNAAQKICNTILADYKK